MRNDNSLIKKRFNHFVRNFRKSTTFSIALILLGLCIFLTITTGTKFLSKNNLLSVFRQFSFTAILAIGQALVIITGGIDLSVGSIFALSSVVSALGMTRWGFNTFVGLFIGCLIGAALGLSNGFFITKLRLPPFIATLGMMSIARGLAYVVTGGFPVSGLPSAFKFIGQGDILGIPSPIILMLILAVIFGFFLHKTIIGRRIYAIGGNQEAAKVSGIRVDRIKLLVYTLCGLLSAISGLATAARLNVAQSTAGQGIEMDAIAAVIIGGASLSGGIGNIAGPVLGAAIMGIIRNGLILLNVTAYWQQTVIGAVVIIAVTFDKMRNQMAD